MADDKDKVSIVFDLDSKEAIEGVLNLKEKITGLGNKENFEDLLSGLTTVGLYIGAAGAAAYAAKKAFDLILDAEAIKATGVQFDILAKKVGLVGDELKEALSKASGGKIDDTDLMHAANKAIVELGVNAKKIPEVMELARKATQIFGGTTLENFEAINTAVATGNMRQLKHMGIIVDSEKAIRKYAEANGIAVNALSEVGKQAAIMNEVLDKGNKSFAGMPGELKPVTSAWQELKVAMNEMNESIALMADKTMGSSFKKVVEMSRDFARDMSNEIKYFFGDQKESSKALISSMEDSTAALVTQVEGLKKSATEKGLMWRMFVGQEGTDRLVKEAEDKIAGLRQRIEDEKKKLGESAGGAEGAAPGGGAIDPTIAKDTASKEILKKNEVKFQAEMLTLKQQALQQELSLNDNLARFEELRAAQKIMLEQERSNKKKQIDESDHLNFKQKAMEKEAIDKDYNLKAKALDEDLLKKRIATLDNYKKHSTSVGDGIAKTFKANSQAQEMSLHDFGNIGEATYSSFETHAVSAFEQVGSGAMDMGDAMKSIILNMLADRAIAEGTVIMMGGVGSLNPVAAAGGAALIAFGGLLRSQAGSHGGGSKVPSAPSMSGGGGESGGSGFSSMSSIADTQAQQEQAKKEAAARSNLHQQDQIAAQQTDPTSFTAPQKTVTIQVQGHYFETEQSKMKMLEMIRSATDATDFKYQQIGGV